MSSAFIMVIFAEMCQNILNAILLQFMVVHVAFVKKVVRCNVISPLTHTRAHTHSKMLNVYSSLVNFDPRG